MNSCGMALRHIWNSIRRVPDVPTPQLGLPSRQQISLSAYEKQNLSRNTRQAVRMLTKEYQYYDGIDAEKSFLFGPEDDDDGFPRIRKGSDAGAFVLAKQHVGCCQRSTNSGVRNTFVVPMQRSRLAI
ncbi:hypothetical protein GQ600_18855 [Phytophthora cactorum]|nr:hypothetical protein GQ600_18855 [Phytophthora cactorum]